MVLRNETQNKNETLPGLLVLLDTTDVTFRTFLKIFMDFCSGMKS